MGARTVVKTVIIKTIKEGDFSVQFWRQDVENQRDSHACIICKEHHDGACFSFGITYVYPDETSAGPQFSACPNDHDKAEAQWNTFHTSLRDEYDKFETENAAQLWLNGKLIHAGFTHERIELEDDDSDS